MSFPIKAAGSSGRVPGMEPSQKFDRGQLRGSMVFGMIQKKHVTFPKTNIAPENRPSQKETSSPTIHF